jgi:hypothetical protein
MNVIALSALIATRKLADEICARVKLKTITTLCDVRRRLSSSEDEGALVAGALHFMFHLQPSFEKVNRGGSPQSPPDASIKELRATLDGIRKQHKALFENAVLPGFEVVEDADEISRWASGWLRNSFPNTPVLSREGHQVGVDRGVRQEGGSEAV